MKKEIFIQMFLVFLMAFAGLAADTNEVQAQPAGTIMMYGSNSDPSGSGWLLCDGSAISRDFYAALFSKIGTTYGAGNGTTTFNIPDFRGKFPLGKSTGGTGATLGGSGGDIDHVHAVDPPSTTTGAPSATVQATILAGSASSPTHTHDVDIAGFNSATANPPFLVVNYIIKY